MKVRLQRVALLMMAALLCCQVALAEDKQTGEKKVKGKKPRVLGKIERLDPRLDALVPKNAKMEILAEGFEWTEGPCWIKDGGYLVFSDIPHNTIFKWKEGEGVSTFMRPAGYTGTVKWSDEPGTNGLLLDPQGRLVMCEHGDRRVTRLDRPYDCIKTVLASHYEGKKLNSPNDGVFMTNGDLYFTDPPYGLPNRYDSKERELDFCGVYRITPEGELTLLTTEMTRPNGIGLSPDQKTLYVAQSDPEAAIWKAFEVKEDGTLGKSRLFYDATEWVDKKPGLPDGMAIDASGNLFATGPGGVHVFSPDGTLLGTFNTGEKTANCTFGEDGTVLYITADMYIARIKLTTKGLGW